MRLKFVLPTEVLLDTAVTKVTAEAEDGAICLLPRHVDFVAALVPGLLSLVRSDSVEEFVAVDEGILVKCAAEVTVSTRNAVRGPDLGVLERTIQEQFLVLDERERKARAATARLEADMVRRFMELAERG